MDIPKPTGFDAFTPTKADLSHCPLCLDKFTLFEEPGPQGKVYFACVKPSCMISIWVRDPMLGRWGRIEQESCPICSEPKMRVFFRSDEYIKMQCHKCKYTIENVDDAKHAALMKREIEEGKRLPPPPGIES